ncbi:MAG: phosphoadenylyl-sulfate reductase [Hasllibacter sp.]
MRLDPHPVLPVATEDAEAILRTVLPSPRTALVSSFGADSAVLLHMVARIAPATPVILVDTEMLFPETLAHQRALAARLGLRDVRRIGPDRAELFARDGDALLHRRDPDACCALRKIRPLERALQGFDAWITGRRRTQAGRDALRPFELSDGRTKVNPLAHWSRERVAAYLDLHDLPRHPLVAKGFASIGCAPCTSAVRPGEDERAGRWRGRDKTECGIHFEDGKAVRG